MFNIIIVKLYYLFFFIWYVCNGDSTMCPGEDESTDAQWTYCAEEDDTCIIPISIKEGFLSYGVLNRWILLPFSNYGNDDLKIICSVHWGDSNINEDKYCCYTNRPNLNNQFGKLIFDVSNKLNEDENRYFVNEKVINSSIIIESLNNINTIIIGTIRYNLMSSNKLEPDIKMNSGYALLSPNKQFALIIQLDGELAIIRIADNHKLWIADGTINTGNNNYLHYQKLDGNLVLYNDNNIAVWSILFISTLDSNVGFLSMQDDGNLVVYNGNNKPLWWSMKNSYIWSNSPVIIRFGNNHRYIYRSFTNLDIKCAPEIGLGEVLDGEINYCQWTYDIPKGTSLINVNTASWIDCGGPDTSGSCNGLKNNVPQWIRFGDDNDGKWHYHLVVTTDSRFECLPQVFYSNNFNALNGISNLRCQRAVSPQYTFHDLTGEWQSVIGCSGTSCGQFSYTLKYGVSFQKDHEITNEWGISVTNSASVEYKIFGASASTTVTSSVIKRTLTSDIFTTETELTISCTEGSNHLYQWITKGTEWVATESQDIKISSKQYLCTSSAETPTCIPGVSC